jgi:hypothetical protein
LPLKLAILLCSKLKFSLEVEEGWGILLVKDENDLDPAANTILNSKSKAFQSSGFWSKRR